MEILFIVGSLRKNSFNRRVADAAMKDLAHKATVRFLDYSHLPLLNADHLYPFGEQAEIVRTAIHDADAIWIFCPEYNGSYPGGLKNLLDFASLPFKQNDFASGTPLMGKPVTVSGAGGKFGTAKAQEKLIGLLSDLKMNVMANDRVMIKLPGSAFATNQWTPDAQDLNAIENQAVAFLAYAKLILAENKKQK